MKTLIINLLVILLAFTFSSCDEVTSSSTQSSLSKDDSEWLIPNDEIFDGGPGRDGIPALVTPDLIHASRVGYLSFDDLVIVVNIDDEIKIYPHAILDWHEIINDGIGSTRYALTYCPLTGSAINWDRVIDGETTTFGVSGLLYNSNLIPYDRKTESNWSQMKLQSVNGALISQFAKTLPLLETNWETARKLFPDAQVVSEETGFSRNYGRYPYGNYKTNHSSLLFPVDHEDSRLNAKERVLGIIDGDATKAYKILDFSSDGEIIFDTFSQKRFLIYGNSNKNIITAFDISEISDTIVFNSSTTDTPWFINDSNGNKYDLFGRSEDKTQQLKPAKSFIAYWFAWATFYQNTELYER